MKKKHFLVSLCACVVHTLWASSIITLDLTTPTNPTNLVVNESGYWAETYNPSDAYRWIEFDLFSFSHIPNAFGGSDVGGGLSYWDGFTYCTSGDTNNYGQSGSSDGWVNQQWGCMAGGGIKTDENGVVLIQENGKVMVEQGIPYLVAYSGYWVEETQGGVSCLQVNFTNNTPYQAVGIYINNHPWPYYGNLYGNGFASPFNKEGDFFYLNIHGMNQQGQDIGVVVTHKLAEYKNGQLHQSPDWQWVDLSALGTVYGIYFTMESSDVNPIFGPNTALYFCLDKLQVRPVQNSEVPTRPTNLSGTATETTIDFTWRASTSTTGIQGYNLYVNGLLHAHVPNTQYVFTNLLPYTSYQIGVEAVATTLAVSEQAFISLSTTDETAPTAPTNLTGTTSEYTMSLSWEASSDNVGVTEYHIYLNGERQKKVTTTAYTLTGLYAGTSYLVEVEARDAAANRSPKTSIILETLNVSANNNAKPPVAFSMYPNPVIDVLHLTSGTTGTVEIYNMQGVKVHTSQLTHTLHTINVSDFSKGMYVVKFNDTVQALIK